jgi:hypothetical protein
MKTTSLGHSYDQYRKEHPDQQTSEGWRIRTAEHFRSKFSREVFKKTAEEKQELKTRMYKYPSKHGAPVPPNN